MSEDDLVVEGEPVVGHRGGLRMDVASYSLLSVPGDDVLGYHLLLADRTGEVGSAEEDRWVVRKVDWRLTLNRQALAWRGEHPGEELWTCEFFDPEPRPSNQTKEWVEAHTFTLAEVREVGEVVCEQVDRPEEATRGSDLPEGALTMEEALERCDRIRRLYDTLASLVRMGARSAARTMVSEVDSGDIQEAGCLTQTEAGGLAVTGWVARHMADAMAAHLDALGVTDKTGWTMVTPANGAKPLRVLTVTAQWQREAASKGPVQELSVETEVQKVDPDGAEGTVPTEHPSVREAAFLREAARALYEVDNTGVVRRVTPEALRAASTRLGWKLTREAEARRYTTRAFELWTKDGHTADLPVSRSSDHWSRDVCAWARSVAGVEIAPCEALALALELV